MLDYIRIACAVPPVRVGDVAKNAEDICAYIKKADAAQTDILFFPELSMTGYTCGDLFFQDSLHQAVNAGLSEILAASKKAPGLTVVVGLPIKAGSILFNCAAVITGGELLGITPKTYLSNSGPYPERRWFSSKESGEMVHICGQDVHLCANTVYSTGNVSFGVELCEDLNAPIPPSTVMALEGAEVILNLSASFEIAGKYTQRADTVRAQSAAARCIYAYCSAGFTESTSDAVFAGHSLIAENGKLLKQNTRIPDSDYWIVQDCDLGIIRSERLQDPTFRSCARHHEAACIFAASDNTLALRSDGTLYPLQKLPFIPAAKADRKAFCLDIFRLQVTGLMQRLKVIGANAVIGISGGLDSTLALLVAVEAMRQLGRPMTDVYGITLPCFGTSDRTYRNAWELMRRLGIQAKEIPIQAAVTQHFLDIEHDIQVHNGTYENSQARERTQILMDFAGMVGGIVVGTGDLSELALGWCTYNGDHMSMYSVNASIPKTLIRWVIAEIAEEATFAPARDVLLDILDTPISPELLPPDAQGKISQQTEDLVGPYALHDFYLYHMLRYGFAPTKIYTLACRAFAQDFDGSTVKKWLKTFYRRFFTQQFKRNCAPDGVKAGPLGLGPRGDWQMPSDASAQIWLDEAENL